MLLSGIFGSQNQIRVWFGTSGRNNGLMYYLSALFLAFLVYRMALRERELNYLTRILSLTSVIFAIYCLVQLLDLDPIAWNNSYNRIIGFLGNPNFSSSALALFSVHWGYKYLQASINQTGGSGNIKFVYVLVSLVMAFLSISTQSLQGVVLLAMGYGLLVFSYIHHRFTNKLLSIALLLIGFMAVTLSFVSFLGIGPFGAYLEQYTLKLRGFYAYFGFKAMVANPLFGVGVDNYVNAFRMYRTEEFVQQYGNQLSSNNAHSIPLQIGSTFGITVFIFYCLLQSVILIRALRIITSRSQEMYAFKGFAILWVLIFGQTLLSIEIIGLGVTNWILGAIVLVAKKSSFTTTKNVNIKNSKRSTDVYLPEWLGPLAIFSIVLTLIPVVLISREDVAYRNIAQFTVTNDDSKLWVKMNFEKLTDFSLLEPAKVNAILPNLYASGLSSEAERVILNLYKNEPSDVYVNDVLATFYQNSNQWDKEIEIRERMRKLSPLDYRLEAILARAYFDNKEVFKLMSSVERLKTLAPGSEEYSNANILLEELRSKS
jgi:hypothetical protein